MSVPGSATRLLLIEDDADAAGLIKTVLQRSADRVFDVTHCSSIAETKAACNGIDIDVILLDLSLPDSEGIDTVEQILMLMPGIPIVVLTGSSDPFIGPACIEAGAQDFLPKADLGTERLIRLIGFAIARRARMAEVERSALTDALTRLPNRKAIMDQVQISTARARRGLGGFALALLDLDGFKAVNDTYGHAAGDEVLVEVARRLKATCRANDRAGRLGGDEFVLVLDAAQSSDRALKAADHHLQQMRRPILIQTPDGPKDSGISASFGMTLCPEQGDDPDILLEQADRAMYAAKRSGKNAIRIFDPAMDKETTEKAAAPSIADQEKERMLAPLRKDFFRHTRERIAVFEEFLAQDCEKEIARELWRNVHVQAHGLAGIAGVFGFEALGDIAREVDKAMQAEDHRSNAEIHRMVESLAESCRQIIPPIP